MELWGAAGGDSELTGGRGGYTRGEVSLAKNTVLYLQVGGSGSSTGNNNTSAANGGYNGGGASYGISGCNTWTASGGGASDLRVISGAWNSADSLRSRIMVAGGGGGAYRRHCYNPGDWSTTYGGHGGNRTGATAVISYNSGYSQVEPTGGTQTSGGQGKLAWSSTDMSITSYVGSFGIGGIGPSGYGYSGGGGGWWGGASGQWSPGAGGSSYISGYTGCCAVTSKTSSTIKSGCTTGTTNNEYSISPYGYSFSSGTMIQGGNSMPSPTSTTNETGHAGNGYARITLISSSD